MRLAWVIALLAVLPACKGKAESGSGSKLKVQLNWVPEPEFGGLYAARDEGAYKKAGLDVEIVSGGAGVPVIQLVASGQADVGVVGGDDVEIARARGVDVVAVFATFQHSPLGVMVHGARGLAKLDDLKSGTLALEPGLPFGAWLKKKYGFAGVTLVPYDGGVAHFLTDKDYAQQCYVTSEPIAAKKKGADAQVFSAKETGFDPYTNVLIVRADALKGDKRKTIAAFVAATREGWTRYLADPKPANATMSKLNSAMDAATFDEVAHTQEPLVKGEAELGTMTAARWKTLGDQLVDIAIIQKAPAPESCFADLR